ncbi:AAA domain-containing protein [Caldalkalibacillus mannanilyticus]|uniref:AAA domain-containing protein n=1 Tax=Caldalkalibacillus mannanilyticus TaxID=1418 RepID=UPI0022773039|nr:AAA domain-containing protein [Caldalkalibacillus mannanilyticus]
MISLYENSISKETLREHYRCHPKIIEFCNQKYYDGALIPFREEKEGDIPLILYRTAKGNHMRKVTHGEERGKFNQRELDVIVEEVMQNHQLCFQSKTDIGFTTPYKKQVKKALNLLDDEIECDTIHKYQGREKSVMIMSTVLDTTFQGKKGISFVDDPCMINVAVSRAQNQFVLVTDNHLFSQFGKEVIDLIRYIEYSTLDENIIDSEIVSVFDLLYKEYSEKLMSYKNRLLNISKQQSEDIIWTLLNDILNESKYSSITCTYQVYLKNLIKSTDNLDSVEQAFVNHNASVDFVVYRKLNKQPVLIIEVDGFAFHENNPEQLKKDELKNNILRKYQLPLLRLPTTGSNEERKIRSRLDEVL